MIHSIDKNLAKNNQYKFRSGNAICTATVEHDGDCIDGEMVGYTNIVEVVTDTGLDVTEEWQGNDYLQDDISEAEMSLSLNNCFGYLYNPFGPIFDARQ